MDVAHFERLVRQGLGRPIVHLLHGHDPAPNREVIREATLNDWRFESSESSHERYVLDLMELSGEFESLRAAVLDTFTQRVSDETSRDNGDHSQLSGILSLLGARGDTEAKEAIWTAFQQYPDDCSLLDDSIRSGDLAHFLELAAFLGERLLEGHEEEDSFCSWSVGSARERFGVRRVGSALAKHSGDPRIAAYRQRARQTDHARPRRITRRRVTPEGWSFEELRPTLTDSRIRARLGVMRWGKTASDSDLVSAAETFLATDDLTVRVNLLAAFGRRPFPRDPTALFSVVRGAKSAYRYHESPHPELLASMAVDALSIIQSHHVRVLAEELVERPGWGAEAADLLVATFDSQADDIDTIARLYAAEQNDDKRHMMTMAIKKELPEDTRRSAEYGCLALLVYEGELCGFCRNSIVGQIVELNALPEWAAEECRWDANTETRAQVDPGWESRWVTKVGPITD